jgi:hypothetical protein
MLPQLKDVCMIYKLNTVAKRSGTERDKNFPIQTKISPYIRRTQLNFSQISEVSKQQVTFQALTEHTKHKIPEKKLKKFGTTLKALLSSDLHSKWACLCHQHEMQKKTPASTSV